MLHRLLSAFLIAILLTTVPVPSAAGASPPPSVRSGWLPLIENSAGFLVVQVELNGHPTTALVDTGVPVVVVSRRLAGALGIPVQPLGKAFSVGGLQAFGKSTGVQLSVGAFRYPPVDVEVGDFPAVESVLGQRIDVIIGAALLAHALLEVDLDRARIQIATAGTTPATDAAVPLSYDTGRGRFEVKLKANGLDVSPVLLDTGSDAGLTMSADTFARLPKPPGGATTFLVAGGGGAEVHSLLSLDRLMLGTERIVGGPAQGEPPGGFLAHAGAAGSIGMGLLRQFDFSLDGTAGRLILRRRSTPVSPPPKSTVGVQGDYRSDRIILLHVMANSPAEKAGLHAGDQICAIDNVKVVNGWNDSPMRNWGTRPPGHKYDISLCSGRAVQVVSAEFY